MTWLIHPEPLLQVIGVVLGAWRLSVLLVFEGGPAGLIRRLRELMGVEHNDDGEPIGIPETFPGSLFGCTWCMTAWTTAALYAILWVAPYVVVGIGTWGAACLLETYRTRM